MIKGDQKALQHVADSQVCAEHGTPLTVAWDGLLSTYYLRCIECGACRATTRPVSPSTAISRGQADTELQPGAQKELERRASETTSGFNRLPKTDLGDNRALSLADAQNVVEFAKMVGLNAFLGHVDLYYGSPRVSIDGYYYLNSKRDNPFRIGCRPMTPEERTAYMFEDGAYCWIAKAFLGEVWLPEDGIGYISKDEYEAMSKRNPDHHRSPVVHDNPQRMAEKRAEWQLLRKLIPLEVVQNGQT